VTARCEAPLAANEQVLDELIESCELLAAAQNDTHGVKRKIADGI